MISLLKEFFEKCWLEGWIKGWTEGWMEVRNEFCIKDQYELMLKCKIAAIHDMLSRGIELEDALMITELEREVYEGHSDKA